LAKYISNTLREEEVNLTFIYTHNPCAVRSIQATGFKIEKMDESDNPLYLIYYSDDKEPLKCFLKVYSDSFNPQNDLAAIMTCSDADKNCAVVLCAEARFPIRYNDLKGYDG